MHPNTLCPSPLPFSYWNRLLLLVFTKNKLTLFTTVLTPTKIYSSMYVHKFTFISMLEWRSKEQRQFIKVTTYKIKIDHSSIYCIQTNVANVGVYLKQDKQNLTFREKVLGSSRGKVQASLFGLFCF